MSPAFIDTPDALIDRCAAWSGAPWLAVDTEFMRERTYYAQLCLVQVATPDDLACIDTLVITDPAPLLTLLYQAGTLKVLHAARQDLEVLYDLRGAPPAPVFDTQIAAAYLGFDDQLGYATLVSALTGAALDKAQTRTNWATRPLSEAQLRYAEDDVHHLRQIYPIMVERLDRLGRLNWVLDDCARLSDTALYRSDPGQAWQRLRNGWQLPPAGQAVLKALAAWRESTAQARNLPRSWVLKDAQIYDIARRCPGSRAELARVADIEPLLARSAEPILEAVALGRAAGPAMLFERPQPLTPDQAKLYDALVARLDAVANDMQLNSSVLATRAELKRLAAGAREARLLQGWRRELLADTLIKLLPD